MDGQNAHYLLHLEDAGFCDRHLGFMTKADALRAFAWYKGRPNAKHTATTLWQGWFTLYPWGYTWTGKRFLLAHDESWASEEEE